MAKTLLPCPFCGHEANFEREGTGRHSCIVSCGWCGARHESSDEGEQSGSSWNQRATQPKADERGSAEPAQQGELVSEEVAALMGERIAFLRDPAVYRGKHWASLTNDERKRAFTKLDGGAAGFHKLWTWEHFDMAVEDIRREHRPPISDALVFELTGCRPEQLSTRDAAIVRERGQARWERIRALMPVPQPADHPDSAQARDAAQAIGDDEIVSLARVASTVNNYRHGQFVSAIFERDHAISFARAIERAVLAKNGLGGKQ